MSKWISDRWKYVLPMVYAPLTTTQVEVRPEAHLHPAVGHHDPSPPAVCSSQISWVLDEIWMHRHRRGGTGNLYSRFALSDWLNGAWPTDTFYSIKPGM